MNDLHLFASACYMISYNLLEEVLNKKDGSLENFYKKFLQIINDSIVMDNNFEELNEISEYEALDIGVDYYECNESSYDLLYDKINNDNKIVGDSINRKKKDMDNFVKELKRYKIPQQANEENQNRILSFPWCISGEILSTIKFLNYKIDY